MTGHSSLNFVAVRGADAATFLNGQFTHNALDLAPDHPRLGAFCTPKGRAIATAVLVKADDHIELWTTTERLPTLVTHLARYVMRAKVTFDDPQTATDRHLPLPDGNALPLAADDIHLRAVAAGVPLLVDATADAFVPQMINLDLLDGIDFAKGCYTGQEIVARTHHLGTVKRRMLAFDHDGPAPFAPGDTVRDSEGSAVGKVVATADQRTLASIRLASAQSALTAGEQNAALGKRSDLPYPIPDLENDSD